MISQPGAQADGMWGRFVTGLARLQLLAPGRLENRPGATAASNARPVTNRPGATAVFNARPVINRPHIPSACAPGWEIKTPGARNRERFSVTPPGPPCMGRRRDDGRLCRLPVTHVLE